MEILLANPRGFCAGVDRAISIVERALDIFEKPIYVRHEVVHNKYVVDGLRARGAVFVEELHQVPDDSIVIFSAHGVSQQVRQEAKRRELKVFDATCPLVTKVHMEVTRASRKGTECILIGHHGHPEVEGTMGQYANADGGIYLVETPEDVGSLTVKDPNNLFYCSQTTLSVDDTADVIEALRDKFPEIHGPRKDDICYATQNRQDAVRDLADKVDLLLVVGARNSSNSNRLRELADKMGTQAYLIDDEKSISSEWFTNVNRVGVTAGASAPEVLVQQVISHLKALGGKTVVENPGQEENVVFAVPVELR
ncbi:4-hydroxy-3-methylbut-2-enyl diphosphate reductase [Pseudoalteromonas luteoviolacea]|uniref:4-hydroxy-3-methylbut-2-enyl diphosphate reductase n=1 Tax=Pseudoalteromonas luteoviolacea NCIMB 1942 TaxID=1365253 RepID=A0A167AN12_9GAMM|nr:4-hydroxy-3-methylbut-2-enyl diphosphate reductase [Pseudoalteromonas luteoviolacea]KZN45599.1 4-hydroxy-3-methylbut-2-enyl diphosphate reductase [Pseudoalteromonas luteoviolacea NCIMB 1942]KZW98583.1 4-hydroxy-3-methylbut-2-enyl diphosphate reductase [Pseudoalteromonas luteoviolacea]